MIMTLVHDIQQVLVGILPTLNVAKLPPTEHLACA